MPKGYNNNNKINNIILKSTSCWLKTLAYNFFKKFFFFEDTDIKCKREGKRETKKDW